MSLSLPQLILTSRGLGENVVLLVALGLLGLGHNVMGVSGYFSCVMHIYIVVVCNIFFKIVADQHCVLTLMQIQINEGNHNYASRARVACTMASQAWVAERVIPLLKRKPNIGPKAVQ